MVEHAGDADVAIGVVAGIDPGPVGGGGRRRGGRVDARVDPGDQVELPRPPLDLPDAQRGEADRPQQGEAEEQKTAQGWLLISVPVIGIMFRFRWCMIHSDPPIQMTTSTAVKA